MKLSELSETDYVRALVIGDSGAGKSCLIGSFPGQIEYWDFDNKSSSIAKHYKGHEVLERINVTNFAAMPLQTRMTEFNKKLKEVITNANTNKPLGFHTLALDSLTTFCHYLMEDYIHVSQKGLKRALEGINGLQDYQLIDKHVTQTIAALNALNCNLVVTGHLVIEKDETTGAMVRQISLPGKSLPAKLPIYFEEVYVAKVMPDGKHVLQTQSDGIYKCRSQRKLPKEVPTSYSNLGV